MVDILSLALLCCFTMLTAADEDWKKGLGQVVYLNKQKNIGDPNPDASLKSIFKSLPDSCFSKKRVDTTEYSRSNFNSTSSFYQDLASEIGLSASFYGTFTLGGTLETKTGKKFGGTDEVAGTSVNIISVASAASIEKDCTSGRAISLSNELSDDLRNLPEVSEPELQRSWNLYRTFLRKYGSHVVTRRNYGASIKQFTFSKKELQYHEKQLNVKSCVDFGLGNGIPFTLGVCSETTQEDINSVSGLTVTAYTEIRGGTNLTRGELETNRSDALINKLMKEGREHETPLNCKYTPIWEILQARFINDPKLHAYALNLEQYYMGYLEFDCSLLEPTDMPRRRRRSVDNLQLRRFQLSPYSTKENPEYWCVLEREGCHRDEDCKSETSNGVVKTYCYGKTSGCVEYISLSPEMVDKCVGIREKKK